MGCFCLRLDGGQTGNKREREMSMTCNEGPLARIEPTTLWFMRQAQKSIGYNGNFLVCVHSKFKSTHFVDVGSNLWHDYLLINGSVIVFLCGKKVGFILLLAFCQKY